MSRTDVSARIDDSATIARVDGMVAAEVDNQIVVMSLDSGNFYQLNRVGTRIWAELESPVSVGDLCATLERAFDVAPDQCRSDVGRFLAEMADGGIVRVTPRA